MTETLDGFSFACFLCIHMNYVANVQLYGLKCGPAHSIFDSCESIKICCFTYYLFFLDLC